MKRALRTLAVTVPATLLALTGTAAQAATWTHADQAGDATRTVFDLETGESTFSAAPEDRGADATRFTVRHLARKLILTVRVADLSAAAESSFGSMLQTPRGRFVAMAASGPASYTFVLVSSKPGRDGVRCNGGIADFDDTANTITMVVPRDCLGNPAWVRAGALTTSGGGFDGIVTSGDFPETLDQVSDDALRTGGRAQRPTLSPKVRVG